MDLTPLERPSGKPTFTDRLVRYALGTLAVCAVASVIGEAFFPAVLPGDSGGNDLAGVAAVIWGLGAFVFCVVGATIDELHLRQQGKGD